MSNHQDVVAALLGCLSSSEPDDLCHELDEIVHDLAAQDESIPLGAVDEADADEIADRRSAWASDKNNEGAREQLLYILGAGGGSEALQALENAAASSHERLKLREVLAGAGLL